MGRLIEREKDEAGDLLYPVEIPGHVWPRRSGIHRDQATLFFTAAQLTTLRANAAAALLKADRKKKPARKS
jgi:hypothetical protein